MANAPHNRVGKSHAASEEVFDLKHNDEGGVRLRPFVVTLVDGERFTRREAKELLAQLGRLLEIARILGGPVPLSPERRSALENEFAALAAQLFE